MFQFRISGQITKKFINDNNSPNISASHAEVYINVDKRKKS
jgi:hypothetical protein